MKCNALFLVFHLVGGAFGQWLIGGDPNTCCPLGPFALSLPFGGIPRTCIDTETGKRCYYTYIPNCAGENSPLVYDIHGWFSCPLYNKLFSGWKQMADENCFVVVWPMVRKLISSSRKKWIVNYTRISPIYCIHSIYEFFREM